MAGCRKFLQADRRHCHPIRMRPTKAEISRRIKPIYRCLSQLRYTAKFLTDSAQLIRSAAPRRLEAWAVGTCLMLTAWATIGIAGSHANIAPGASSDEVSAVLKQQREDYKKAESALWQGQMSTYRTHRERLNNYPLAIYLDYDELRKKLGTLPRNDVERFINDHPDSFLSGRLRYQWLNTLAQKNQWALFTQYYDPKIASTELQCHALYARLHQGDQSAHREVAPLWAVGKSQPKACDPLFDRWIKANQLTQDIVWERFGKAVQAGNLSLARYVARRLNPSYSRLAELWLDVYQNPQHISQHRRFLDKTSQMQDIILSGLTRYARHQPMKALKEWEHYDAEQRFTDEQRGTMREQLAIQLVRNNEREAADKLMEGVAQINDTYVAELLLREALRAQDWPLIYRYVNQLSPQDRETEQWRYWRARSIEELQAKSGEYVGAREIYTELAKERSYYGFLAADRLGLPYQLNDIPVAPAAETVAAIARNPAMIRAKELLAVNDELNATREWYFMSSKFTRDDEHLATAQLIYDLAWYPKTIISLANVKAWDDLRLRFPLAYNKEFMDAAKSNKISPLLLLAIARQESAFAVNARSPVGATGLMQLMPATAAQTARKVGIKFEQKDLHRPATNIVLGSAYITELLGRFDDNRILAAAAYNAGPSRVNQWLARTGNELPYDVWIDVIPFKETRKYVQNILAYSVIYGYRMGTTPVMLNPHEVKMTL